MRIAFVTESWLPATNGVVTRLSATIDDLCRRGHQVLVIAPDGGPADDHGVQTRRVPAVGISFIYDGHPWGLPLPRVARFLREFQPDLVHVVNPMLLGMAGVWAARRLRIPLVASYHTDVSDYAGFYHLAWLRPVIRRVVRLLHGKAAVNLATSTYACARLQSYGVPDVRLWRRGVDLDLFHPSRRAPPSADAVGRERITALYVGRLAQEKGIDRLAPLVEPAGRVDLLLVGDGPGTARVAARFADAPVALTGTLHGRDLADAYANADVFVFPSTTETLGLVLLEALASGLPVVSVDTPASREITNNCRACRLFPADRPERLPEVVEEFLASAPRRLLSKHARAEAERWSWRAATDELLDYYDEALSQTSQPRSYATG